MKNTTVHTGKWKIFLFSFIVFSGFFLSGKECAPEEAVKILDRAFEKIRTLDMTGTVKFPLFSGCDYPEQERKYPNHICSMYLCRKLLPDGTADLRAELLNNRKEVIASVIQNRDGIFVLSSDEKYAFQSLSSVYARSMEHVYLPVAKQELEYSVFDIEDVFMLGENCWKITVSVPPGTDRNELLRIFGNLNWYFGGRLPRNRPFVREFVIGKKTYNIYSRKSFNENGALVYSFEYDSYTENPEWSGKDYLFRSSAKVLGYVDDESYGISLHWSFQHPPKYRYSKMDIWIMRTERRIKEWFKARAEELSDSPAEQFFVCLCIGALFMGAGFLISRLRKK